MCFTLFVSNVFSQIIFYQIVSNKIICRIEKSKYFTDIDISSDIEDGRNKIYQLWSSEKLP